jgi:uncharacterized protein (DUF58 family)
MTSAEPSARANLLDPKLLQSLGNMRLRARAIVEGAIAGLHQSALKGGSVEFTEYKEYSPGDEIRHIDWRGFARTDRYYVKQFEEETNLRAYLLLDRSGSMDFGFEDAVPKSTYAAYLGAALAYLFVRQGDAVGLLTFDEEPRLFLEASARHSHLDDVFKVLEQRPGRDRTDLAAALSTMAERGQRRSLVFVLSDLLDTKTEAMNMAKVLRRRKFEVVLFHLVDPAELTLPYEGLTLFLGLERDGELLVDPDDIRERYVEELARHFARIERDCREADIEYRRVLTAAPLDGVLLDFIYQRGERRGEAGRRRLR